MIFCTGNGISPYKQARGFKFSDCVCLRGRVRRTRKIGGGPFFAFKSSIQMVWMERRPRAVLVQQFFRPSPEQRSKA